MTKGPGYVFETETLNYGGPKVKVHSDDGPPYWMLKISAAGAFNREDVEFIVKCLNVWLKDHS